MIYNVRAHQHKWRSPDAGLQIAKESVQLWTSSIVLLRITTNEMV
jgi:hypothetical protein